MAHVLTLSPGPPSIDPHVFQQKEELERFATTLNYGEKGMVRVQGIFEAKAEPVSEPL